MKLRLLLLILFPLLITTAFLLFRTFRPPSTPLPLLSRLPNLLPPTPTPTSSLYQPPTLKRSSAYTFIFLGDSMTAALGPNLDQLGPLLKQSYPTLTFGLFNYASGSTNILSVDQLLTTGANLNGTTYPAILNRQFDIIFIESFAHNPLSQYPLSEGLLKQTASLDYIVDSLRRQKPESLIVFVATLGPSRTHYALKSRDLTPKVRSLWVDERLSYLTNHISYAQSHNIPLIDIYHQSLGPDGSVDLKYINPDDYIHPSAEGIRFISQSLVDYLYQGKILPL